MKFSWKNQGSWLETDFALNAIMYSCDIYFFLQQLTIYSHNEGRDEPVYSTHFPDEPLLDYPATLHQVNIPALEVWANNLLDQFIQGKL